MDHEAEILPLSGIEPVAASIPQGPFDGVIFTSANAPAQLVAQAGGEKLSDLAAWCVGDKTAQAAREAGFTKTLSGAGDVEELATMVATNMKAGARLLYPRARHVSHDLRTSLPGMELIGIVIYEARLLDPGVRALRVALEHCSGGAALIYSNRSAAHLVALAAKYRLLDKLAKLTLIAISEKTAAAIPEDSGFAIRIAGRPTEGAMLQQLAQL